MELGTNHNDIIVNFFVVGVGLNNLLMPVSQSGVPLLSIQPPKPSCRNMTTCTGDPILGHDGHNAIR